jgi:Phage major tail protein 2.
MANSVGIAGKLLSVKFGDKRIKCQADCTLNFTNNYDEEEGCKPEGVTLVSEGTWIERTLNTQDWSVSVSQRMFLDDLGGASITPADIIALNIAGTVDAEIEVSTTPGQHNLENEYIVTGNVVIGSINLEAPITGKATAQYEFPGNGQPTQSLVPVAP